MHDPLLLFIWNYKRHTHTDCDVSGQKAKFIVRTAGAGSGLLAVFIDGPSKVSLSCKEVDEGYEFIYTPFCAGDYLITIKYGNIPIAGSPWKAVATGKHWPFMIQYVELVQGLLNTIVQEFAANSMLMLGESNTLIFKTAELIAHLINTIG